MAPRKLSTTMSNKRNENDLEEWLAMDNPDHQKSEYDYDLDEEQTGSTTVRCY